MNGGDNGVVIGTGFRASGGYSDGRSGGGDYGGLEVCAPGGVSNGKFSGNIGEIH